LRELSRDDLANVTGGAEQLIAVIIIAAVA
jgi:lactobin A/cerein 7B family class IIb bacteriocin